ncbi:MAG: ROK family protein [Bacteroidetes bacterium]|jgi:glucokinase|nr:MAG: ROK family protein [Bacteroidota bacterium]TAF98198.1 MAG: ROK family protein [Bacteroidota bacterium]
MGNELLRIGIDVGGTSTKFGVVNEAGKILVQDRIPTASEKPVEEFIHALHTKLAPMIEAHGGKQAFKGIGMGAPNGNLYTGNIEYAANLKWEGIVPIAKMVQQKIGLPATLTNDANAAAMGEMMYGAAKGFQHFITITLGTGVGSGIVVDGKMVVGHDGFAGELGHTIVRYNGRLHKGTGSRGSLESYASATGVRETALEFLDRDATVPSLLRNYTAEQITSETVYDCALQGDAIAKEVFQFTGEILGEALANFVMFSSPQAIVLFGGLTKAGSLIMNPTKQAMEANLVQIFKNKVQLIFSNLSESDAAILGASALVQ